MELKFWKKKRIPQIETTEVDNSNRLPTSLEMLQEAGLRPSLFIDSFEGPMPVYDREKAAERAKRARSRLLGQKAIRTWHHSDTGG